MNGVHRNVPWILALLQEKKLISQENLHQADRLATEKGQSLVQLLPELGYISEEEIAKLLSSELKLRYVNLTKIKIPPDAVRMIPESLARQHNLIPILKIQDAITVAMADPLDVRTLERIEHICKCRVQPVVSTPSQIKACLEKTYGMYNTIEKLGSSLGRDVEEQLKVSKAENEQSQSEIDENGPVLQIVRLLLLQAIKQGASDIHIEPTETELRVRYRVDGMLQIATTMAKKIHPAVVSSLKIMAQMNITETRLPQDGRIRFETNGKILDLRVSSLPTMDGEKIVIRILDRDSIKLSLTDLGLNEEELTRFKRTVNKPHGIVLISGPTGSGKTTTLYAVLRSISTAEKNISTLEDPIEYRLDMINQSQVNSNIGFTFAKGLRTLMRQDPDVIMVGEIRDPETAQIAVQAALTGHLVLSTIHTNDAPGAITRLIDMDIEPFLVASALEGVIAQRLIRKLCPFCKRPYEPSLEILERCGLSHSQESVHKFYEAVGCRECNRLGYKGRMGIYEILVPSDKLPSLIVANKPTAVLAEVARKAGMKTLMQNGVSKVLAGKTSIEEVFRVTMVAED